MDLKILSCLIVKLLKSSKPLFVTFVRKQSNIIVTANILVNMELSWMHQRC